MENGTEPANGNFIDKGRFNDGKLCHACMEHLTGTQRKRLLDIGNDGIGTGGISAGADCIIRKGMV